MAQGFAKAGAVHEEAHSVASHNDTTATGAELETLTDGSDADALHTHSADGIDTSAIHDNESAEISVITEKGSPVSADLLLIEDSASSNVKKRVQIGNLPDVGTDLTTKGDIHGYDTGQARVPVGANDEVLTADSAQALGVKWAAATGGGGVTHALVAKTVDETVNNTTLQNDDVLLFAIAANETWIVDISLRYSTGATPDFKWDITIPGGATIKYSIVAFELAGTVRAETAIFPFLGGGPQDQGAHINCVVTNGGTAGNVQFRFAQNTSDASDTKVLAGSNLIAHLL